jgi:hypothetical protein
VREGWYRVSAVVTDRSTETLAVLCLAALADLGGEATQSQIRAQAGPVAVSAGKGRVSKVMNGLALRDPPPVVATADGEGGRGRERRWRLAGSAPSEVPADALLSRDDSRRAGRNAARLRKASGRRQKDVAAEAGFGSSVLSLYESGSSRIPVSRARALARVLGTTLEALAADPGGEA